MSETQAIDQYQVNILDYIKTVSYWTKVQSPPRPPITPRSPASKLLHVAALSTPGGRAYCGTTIDFALIFKACHVEVRDSQGKLIGFFVPAVTTDEVDQYECHISGEKLRRRARDEGASVGGNPDDLRKSS